jgi:predicted site-specific integrase-resolvase
MEIRYLNERELSEKIGVCSSTLRTWRSEGRGPSFIKAEGKKGAIRYKLEAVEKWLEESKKRAVGH